ncbi:MAG: serine hydrolase [Gemmatimonadetes bacterium]|nr:serine hydrolase [Gemmatimonadota bacterium]
MARLWLVFAPCFLFSAPLAAQERFPPDSAVQALLDEAVRTGRTAGVVIGLLEADGTRRVLAAGDAGSGTLPLDGETVFEIGSITKVFTAIALSDMALRGEVTLAEPVEGLLPEGVKVPARNGKPITLLLLTTHYSGLPRLPGNMRPSDTANPYADYTVQQMYDFLSGHALRRDPGDEYEYSNYAVGLLGHALALLAGTTYEELLRGRILDPLGMSHTAITLTPWMEAHLATGHDLYGGPAANWDVPTLAGAGGLRSTVHDMLEFVAANLSDAGSDLSAAMDSTHRPRRQVGESADSIAMGWHVSHHGGRTITAHNGRTGGYRSFLGMDLEASRAVVLLTNTSGDGLDDMGLHLLVPSSELQKPAIGPAVARAWRTRGVENAADLFRTGIAEPDAWRLGASELNAFGQWLLQKGETEDAIVFLRLNVETFPESGAGYNSLAHGYRAAGRLEEARDSYARALEMAEANGQPWTARYRANLRRAERELEERR